MCLILIFLIPYGVFVCWVPFILPHKFSCSNCFNNGKEAELVSIDWRDREKLIEQEKAFEEDVLPLMEKWFEREGKLFKLSRREQKNWLIEVSNDNTRIFRIKYYRDNTLYLIETELEIVEFDLQENESKPTMEGKLSLTDTELSCVLERNIDSLRNYISTNHILVEPFEMKMGDPEFIN
ncbi:hypothetical protein [Bacillus alkalicellulosilyticus]|uniref:hypothetical protein n=1 Tax=Alkalihalobacterium alkalicellulosilyticum TaxID=1912214 RepID=UPI000997EFBB|nr:hypothetical protein [Bacillus alkalicellulosilyticus]